MSDPLLEALGLRKSYSNGQRRIDVLQGLDLSVARSDTVAIVGESGVGKSTLLHLLGGLDVPDGGRLRFEGRDVVGGNPAELADFRNRHVGFVFQFHHLLPEFTARENVEMPLRIAGRTDGMSPRASEILERLGLAERLDHVPGQLSGGEQQRVAIARALIAEPRLILADEPTGNLDPATGGRVFEALTGLQRERGFALVLATHNERLADGCDRVMRLAGGTLEALDEHQTRDYFGGSGAGTR